jgi:hypothetical protein
VGFTEDAAGEAARRCEESVRHMSIEVEVNLRIPRAKVPTLDENGYPIDHSSIRFTKLIEVQAIPKPGVVLQLTTSSGRAFECEVTRADWNEEKERFILSCRYAKRSIAPEDCAAFFNDPDWQMKPLL